MKRYSILIIYALSTILLSCLKTEDIELEDPKPISHQKSLWKEHLNSYRADELIFDIEFSSKNKEYVLLCGKKVVFLNEQFKKISETAYESFDSRRYPYRYHLIREFFTNYDNPTFNQFNVLYQYALDIDNRSLQFKGSISPIELLGYNKDYTCTISDQYPDINNIGLPISLFIATNYNTSETRNDLIITRKGRLSSDTSTLILSDAKRIFTRILSNKQGYILYNEGSNLYMFISADLKTTRTYFLDNAIKSILVSQKNYYIETSNEIFTIDANGQFVRNTILSGSSLVDVVNEDSILIYSIKHNGLAIYDTKSQIFNSLPHSLIHDPINRMRVVNDKIISFSNAGVKTYSLK